MLRPIQRPHNQNVVREVSRNHNLSVQDVNIPTPDNQSTNQTINKFQYPQLQVPFYLQAACCHLLLLQTQHPFSSFQTILLVMFPNPLKKKKKKRKNWAKDYADLAKLLPSDLDTDKPDHKFSIVDGQLIMSPKTTPKKIHTIDSWTDAFIIFSSIYLLRHPTDIQSILKYVQTIK